MSFGEQTGLHDSDARNIFGISFSGGSAMPLQVIGLLKLVLVISVVLINEN